VFVGHFAVAFGAKRAVPAVSLGALFIACQLADLVWPLLVIAGIERVSVQPGLTVVTPLDFIYYPFSHSLVAAAAWALVFGAAYMALRNAAARSGAVLALVADEHVHAEAQQPRLQSSALQACAAGGVEPVQMSGV